MRHFISFVLIVVFLGVSGCTWQNWYGDFATPHSKFAPPPFERIAVGNSKEQVVQALGKPDSTAAISTSVEVWEYWLYEAIPGPDRVVDRYQVKFGNGKVTGWGRDVDSVQEIRDR